jgi:hypothetical protein
VSRIGRLAPMAMLVAAVLAPLLAWAEPAGALPPSRLAWVASSGGAGQDRAWDLAVDAAGNSFAVGWYSGPATFGAGPAQVTLPGAGSKDVFLAKYDPNGTLLWVRSAGGAWSDTAYGVALDAAGNPVVVGQMQGAATFGSGPGAVVLTVPLQGAFAAKYGSDGTLQWARVLGGDMASSVDLDASGNIFVAGQFFATTTFGQAPNQQSLTAAGDVDAFLQKLTPTGVLTWVRGGGGTGSDFAWGVAVDPSGNPALAGWFSNAATFVGGVTTIPLTSSGNADGFIVRYDAAGTASWGDASGGPASETAWAITADNAGNYWIGGFFVGLLNLGGNTIHLAGSGGDGYLARYSSAGAVTQTRLLPGSGLEMVTGVDTDATGQPVFSGTTTGNATVGTGPNAVAVTNVAPGTMDTFVAHLDGAGAPLSVDAAKGPADDLFRRPNIDSAGVIRTAGWYSGSTAIGSGSRSTSLTSAGGDDVIVARYGLNQAPVASAATVGALDGIGLPIVLAATDPDGDTLHYAITTGPASGALSGVAPNVTYTANPGFSGPDAFTFTVTDDFGGSSSAIVTVNVTLGPPVAGSGLLWAKSINGPFAQSADASSVDAAGNVYTVGSFNWSAAFGSGGSAVTLTSTGGYDNYLAKHDKFGAFLWARRFGGPLDDTATGVAVDAAGRVTVTGSYKATATFGQGAQTTTKTSSGGTEIYVAQYDTSGILQWVVSQGSAEDDTGHSVAADAAGNTYVSGDFRGFGVFGPAPTPTIITTAGGLDSFVAKYAPDGTLVWVRSGGSAYDDLGWSIAVTATGAATLVGTIGSSNGYQPSTASFGPGPGSGPITGSGYASTGFVVRYDSGGNVLWANAQQYTAPEGLRRVATDAAGTVWIAGHTWNAVTGTSGDDVFVRHLDASGATLWTTTGGGNDVDRARGLAIDAAGNAFVAGSFRTTATFTGPTRHVVSTSAGSDDIFTIKLDPTGDPRWIRAYGTSGLDQALNVAVDGAGNPVVAGLYSGALTVGEGAQSVTLPAASGWDAFLLELGTNQPNAMPTIDPLTVHASTGSAARFTLTGQDGDGDTIAFSMLVGPTHATVTGSGASLTYTSTAGYVGPDSFTVQASDGAGGSSTRLVPVVVKALPVTASGVPWGTAITPNGAGAGSPFVASVQVDDAGNTYAAGAYSSPITLGQGPSTVVLSAAASTKSFVARYDADGELAWAFTTEANLFPSSYKAASALDPDGSLLIVATGWGPASIASAVRSIVPVPATTSTGLTLLKIDPSGVIVRATPVISSSIGSVDLAIAPDGSVAVVGGFVGPSVTVGAGPTQIGLVGSESAIMPFVAVFEPSGNARWAQTSTAGAGTFAAVAFANDGRVVVNGYASTPMTLGTGATVTSGSPFIASFGTTGTVNWVVPVTHVGSNPLSDLAPVAGGDVVVAGRFDQNLTLGGPSPVTLPKGTTPNGFLARIDSSGAVQWTRRIGGTSSLGIERLAARAGRGLAVVGTFAGQLSVGGSTEVSGGQTDAFVATFTDDGTGVWARPAGGPFIDAGTDVGIDAAGNVRVAGGFVTSASIGVAPSIVTLTGTAGVTSGLLVSFGVDQSNRWPSTSGQTLWTPAAAALPITLSAFDPDADALTYTVTTGPSHGTLTGSGANRSYTAASTYIGLDSFDYTVADGRGGIATATITINVAEPSLPYEWAAGVSSTAGSVVRGMAHDSAGNLYASGWVGPSATFGFGLGKVTITGTGTGAFLAKYDQKGALLWVKRSGGTVANAVTLDATGNLYVAGTYASGAAFGQSPSQVFPSGAGGFLAKYDANGSFLWVRTMTSGQANAVAVTSAGQPYVAGTITATSAFGQAPSQQTVVPRSADGYVAKFEPDGTLDWVRLAGGTGADAANGVDVDPSGNAVLVGTYAAAATFGTGPTAVTLAAVSGSNGFVAKFDSSGSVLFASLPGGNASYLLNGVAVDSAANIYAVGNTVVLKLQPAGALTWAQPMTLSTSYWNSVGGFGIDVDPSGAVTIAGGFYGPVVFGGYLTVPKTGAYGNAFAARFSSVGVIQWVQSVGSGQAYGDTAYAVTVGPRGEVWFGGMTNTRSTIGTGPGALLLDGPSHPPTGDVFVARYSGVPVADDQTIELPVNSSRSLTLTGRTPNPGALVYSIATPPAHGTLTGTPPSVTYTPDPGYVGPDGFTFTLSDGTPQPDTGVVAILVRPLPTAGTGLAWATRGGSTSSEEADAVVVDAVGDTFVTGCYHLTATFGSGANARSITANNGVGGDIFVAKYDPAGQLVNVWSYGGNLDDCGLGIAIDATGNIVVAGRFELAMTIGTTQLVSAGASDAFVMKLAPNGTLLWAARGGSTGFDEATGVAVAAGGAVYATGAYNGVGSFTGGATTVLQTSVNNNNDAFLWKLSTDGLPQWVQSAGGDDADKARAVTVGPSGDVFVAGTMGSWASLGEDSAEVTLISAGGTDAFMARYGPDGALRWARSAGGTGTDAATGIAIGSVGDLYVTGSITGGATFGSGGGALVVAAAGAGANGFVVKVSATDGNPAWVRTVAGTGVDSLAGVAVDLAGNVFVAGSFDVSAVLDGPGGVTVTGTSTTALLVTYSSAGSLRWVRTAGGTAVDQATDVAVDVAGNARLVGSFNLTATFGDASGTIALTSAGSTDAFVASYGAAEPAAQGSWAIAAAMRSGQAVLA